MPDSSRMYRAFMIGVLVFAICLIVEVFYVIAHPSAEMTARRKLAVERGRREQTLILANELASELVYVKIGEICYAARRPASNREIRFTYIPCNDAPLDKLVTANMP